jgi:hypothetical protein
VGVALRRGTSIVKERFERLACDVRRSVFYKFLRPFRDLNLLGCFTWR